MVWGRLSHITDFSCDSSVARRDKPLSSALCGPCTFIPYLSQVTGDGPAMVSHSCLYEALDLSSATVDLEFAGGKNDAGDSPQAAHSSEH